MDQDHGSKWQWLAASVPPSASTSDAFKIFKDAADRSDEIPHKPALAKSPVAKGAPSSWHLATNVTDTK